MSIFTPRSLQHHSLGNNNPKTGHKRYRKSLSLDNTDHHWCVMMKPTTILRTPDKRHPNKNRPRNNIRREDCAARRNRLRGEARKKRHWDATLWSSEDRRRGPLQLRDSDSLLCAKIRSDYEGFASSRTVLNFSVKPYQTCWTRA